MKKICSIVLLMSVWVGTVYGTTAAKGVFTAGDKTVQFANANETGLKQWSDANGWSYAHKDDDGHNGWFVLDHDQWSKLLSPIDGSRTNARDLNNLGTVAGDSGLIILPDGWVQPAGVPTFKTVSAGIYYDLNVYTAAEWALMEKSGAVFLPCQGYSTDGSAIENAKTHGAYWSSDAYSAANGYCVRFNNGEIHDQNDQDKDIYYSVRLVKEVEMTELDETHEADDFEDDLEAATGKSFAIVNRTFTKDGTLYTLCLPFDVPNINASPLAGAEVFAFAGGTVSGTTGNEVLHLALTRLSGTRLTQGVPYLLRWSNTGESLSKLCFYDVANWDDNTTAATDPGDTHIKFHGVYPKAHIEGYDDPEEAHYNFFLGANNTLYWPDDATYGEDAKMKGFRAYFYIVHDDPDPSPVRRGMQAVWEIDEEGSATGIEVRSETASAVRSEKIFREGQIVIVIDGKEYNILGLKIGD